MSGFEFTFMGQAAAFDAVTLYGLLVRSCVLQWLLLRAVQEHKMKRAPEPRPQPSTRLLRSRGFGT